MFKPNLVEYFMVIKFLKFIQTIAKLTDQFKTSSQTLYKKNGI